MFEFTGELSRVDGVALVCFFFVGGWYISRIGDDAVDVVLLEHPQGPEAAEARFVDDMVDAAWIACVEIGKQFQGRWIHGECLQFDAGTTDAHFPVLSVHVDPD